MTGMFRPSRCPSPDRLPACRPMQEPGVGDEPCFPEHALVAEDFHGLADRVELDRTAVARVKQIAD